MICVTHSTAYLCKTEMRVQWSDQWSFCSKLMGAISASTGKSMGITWNEKHSVQRDQCN